MTLPPETDGPRSPHASPDAPHLVFDLTDIMVLLHRQVGVGGIVRVVLQIMRHVVGRPDAGDMIFVFHHPKLNRYVAVDPALIATAIEEPATVIHGFDLVDAYFPINEFKYRDRPFRAWLRRHRRYLQFRSMVQHRRPEGEARPAGWALRPCQMPAGRARVAVLGTSWALNNHPGMLRELCAEHDAEVVLLIHDLIPLMTPPVDVDNPEFRHWFEVMAGMVRRYVSVSAFTAREITARVPLLSGHVERLDVVPLAHEFDYSGPIDEPGIEADYVLAVGSLGYPRKNFARLLEAWLRLHDRIGQQLPVLVLAGNHGSKKALLDQFLARYPQMRGMIILDERPGDARLAGLYSHCLFTVYPSLFEGWGLPVGESAWFGKLCVASRVSSIPEVVGDAADYFDPHSVDDMVETLIRPITDRAYLRQREQDLLAIRRRSWNDVANDLVAALRN